MTSPYRSLGPRSAQGLRVTWLLPPAQHTLFGDKLCTVASLRDKYGDMADCCEKQEPDRNECFLAHKDDNPGFPPLVAPEPDALCAAFQDNEQLFLGK